MGRIPQQRSRRPRKAPAQPRGLRVRLEGTRDTGQLREMLLEAVLQLEALGIDQARGVNIYLTPVNGDGTPVTPVRNGQSVRTITVEEPYRSAAEEHGL